MTIDDQERRTVKLVNNMFRVVIITTLLLVLGLVAFGAYLLIVGPPPRHFAKISCLSFSPDGQLLVVARHDATDGQVPYKGYTKDVSRTISLLQVPSLSTERVVEHDVEPATSTHFSTFWHPGNSVGFTGDSKTLVICDFGMGPVALHELETSRSSSFMTDSDLYAFDAALHAPRGLLATGHTIGIRVWDLNTGDEVCRIETQPRADVDSPAAAFSPDGQLLATAGFDGVILWNATDGARVATIEGSTSTDRFTAVCFHPSTQHLAVGTSDWLRVYDLDGTRVADLISNGVWLDAAVFSPQGDELAVAGVANIQVFNAKTWGPVRTIPTVNRIACLAYSPDGSYLAAGDHEGHVLLLDADLGDHLAGIEPPSAHDREVSR